MITCTNCGRPYPEAGLPYRCMECGGVYDFDAPWSLESQINSSQPGIWRFRSSFGLPSDLEPVTLGEGNTPLIWAERLGREIAFKCEYMNPTGSFKDRGSAIIANWLKARKINSAIEDSSGNAGASIAAYTARAGIGMKVFVPAGASGPKRYQIEAFGAMLESVEGTRSDVARAVQREAGSGVVYASHAWLPFNLPGYATAAYEIVEQLNGRFPGSVIVPVGQGGFLLGLSRGFEAMRVAIRNKVVLNRVKKSTIVPTNPQFIGVQAAACAPLWAMYSAGLPGLGFVAENATLAEGVKVRYPVRSEAVLKVISESRGMVLVVEEHEILEGRDELARRGFYVEPTSAIVWSALKRLKSLPEPIVVMLTGSGLKYI